MSIKLRFIQIGMVASIALFFSIVGIDNILDYSTNWLFVQHVLSMDTTFQSPALMGRAITNPIAQKSAYCLIIVWELVTAFICWIGCGILLTKIRKPSAQFHASKEIAFIGLFMGFVLYMVGFIIIGSEWFSMWQSKAWNGQMAAGLFISLIMFVMIFLKSEE